jgi:hypothetical protein
VLDATPRQRRKRPWQQALVELDFILLQALSFFVTHAAICANPGHVDGQPLLQNLQDCKTGASV